MTIKQYGSLTLDLNNIITIKPFKVKEWYSSYSGDYDFNLVDSYQVILKDKEIYIVDGGKQLYKDYQEFILQKKAKVIKEAFESVWGCDWEVYKFQLPFNIRNKDIRIDIYPSGISVCCSKVRVEPPNFNINSTDKEVWISYAQQIKDAYLDSLVDPVKVANQVLKSRKLDKEWVAQRNINGKELVLASNKERLSFYPTLGKLTIWAGIGWKHYLEGDVSMDYPTTNLEWVKAIEFALNKYYKLLKQPNKVDLKLMLDKALKDNGLVAKEVFTTPEYCLSTKALVNFGDIKLKWTAYSDKTIFLYLIIDETESILSTYSFPKVIENWQTIFSNSLTQYKQLDKLRQPKLTRNDIIECLESALQEFLLSERAFKPLLSERALQESLLSEKALEGLHVEHIRGTLEDSLVGTIEVKLTKHKLLTWVIDKDSVIVRNHKGDCGFSVPFPYLPNTKEKWKQLFVTSLKQLLPVSKEPEPTLIDLLEKAFPKFTWIHKEKKYINTFIGTSFLHKIKVISNIKTDEILEFDLSAKNASRIHKMKIGVITKQNLANSTGWQEWLDSVIESKANLDNLVSNPTVKDYLTKDVW